MSEYDGVVCPICMVSELTAATKVYPLCQCKLGICFDCLKRWAETKYCCPFCNIPFTQIALQQTEDELRVRLRGKVETGKLKEVVRAWAELLKHLRTEMEVGLTVLNIDLLGDDDDDDGFYDLVGQPLQRSRTPFFPSHWGQISSTSSLFSNILNTRIAPQLVLNNANNGSSMLIVQPSLSMSLTQPSNIPRVLPPPQTFRNADNEELPIGFSRETEAINLELRSYVNEKLVDISGQPHTPDLGQSFSYMAATVPGNKILLQDISSLPLESDCSVRAHDLNIPMTPNNWVGLNSLRNMRQRSADNLSTYSTASKVEELIRKNGDQVKHILSKQLNVRWLVSLRPGTMLARRYGPNALGVIMKHVEEYFGKGSKEMTLTVRLLDGSWLTKVPVKDLISKGRRATLTEWLRIGDLVWTRFGICMVKELHPNLGQVTVQFLGRFIDPWECSSRNRHVIYEELRSVLYNSRSPSRFSEADELKYDKRLQKEEIKGKHIQLEQVVDTPLSDPKIKYNVTPFLPKPDTGTSGKDADNDGFFFDSDDINLESPSLGMTKRESVPIWPHSSKEDMEGEDMIVENESMGIKHTVTPTLPMSKTGISIKYPGEDRSPVLDNGDINLPLHNIGRTERRSILIPTAAPQEEIIEKRTTSEKKEVVRVVGLPPSGTKAKRIFKAMLSKTNTDISTSETEQEGSLVLDCSDFKLDPSRPATPVDRGVSLADGIEEPVIQKDSLNFPGLTFSSGSFVFPDSEPVHRKAGTRQSYQLEFDLPEFNFSPVGKDKPTIRIIWDTDIKTVLSSQDLIARIEKRAKRLEIIRTGEIAEERPISIEIHSKFSRR